MENGGAFVAVVSNDEKTEIGNASKGIAPFDSLAMCSV